MFDSFLLLLMLTLVFGGLFFVAKYTLKMKNTQQQYNIGKVLTSFPISCKSNGYIVEVAGKHYLCCEGSGVIEVSITDEMKDAMNSNSFTETLAKDISKLKGVKDNLKTTIEKRR